MITIIFEIAFILWGLAAVAMLITGFLTMSSRINMDNFELDKVLLWVFFISGLVMFISFALMGVIK